MENNKKILVVDDSPLIRKMIKHFLPEYHIVEAENGIEALEKLFNEEFNLIITDINMPKMDGFELIKQIRLDSFYKFVPIIILTTEDADEEKEKSKKLKVNAYIVKPVEPKTLNQCVEKYVKNP